MFDTHPLNRVAVERVRIRDEDTGEAEVIFNFGHLRLHAFTDFPLRPGPTQVVLELRAKAWGPGGEGDRLVNVGVTDQVNLDAAVLAIQAGVDGGSRTALLGCHKLNIQCKLDASAPPMRVGDRVTVRGRLDIYPATG